MQVRKVVVVTVELRSYDWVHHAESPAMRTVTSKALNVWLRANILRRSVRLFNTYG